MVTFLNLGCPLLPILFNLFINDIFRDCNRYGVSIGSSLCCGGLFADDIVLCTPTRGSLYKLLKEVKDFIGLVIFLKEILLYPYIISRKI